MKTLKDFKFDSTRVVFTDIDGTLTQDGRLPEGSYSSLWQLANAGLKIVPVTGRPAGWCEMIARLWPVHGVVGENGAFYFSLVEGKMKRHFVRPKVKRKEDRANLRLIRQEVLAQVPGSAVASDQFSRLFDLAIDFSEDVPPLSKAAVDKIVKIFVKHGAVAKVSNIHVNGWFGDYDKVSTCRLYCKKEFNYSEAKAKQECIFVGDSPNDEPMFAYFPHSFAVANIRRFLADLKYQPAFVADHEEGEGFCQIAERLLALRARGGSRV